MSITIQLTEQWQRSGEVLGYLTPVTITATGSYDIDESIPGPSTDQLVALTLDVSQLKALYLWADQDLTLQFNSHSSPTPAINLTANKAVVWYLDGGLTCPLSVDVTSLHVVSAASVAANLKCRFLFDPTV